MAKQIGDIKLEGTLDEICFYKMESEYYARVKSSLTAKRFWKDPAFAGSRRSSGRMAGASPIASRLYRTLPKERKGGGLFNKLVGRIILFLKEGREEEQIKEWFLETYFPQDKKPAVETKAIREEPQKRKASLPLFQKPLFALPFTPKKKTKVPRYLRRCATKAAVPKDSAFTRHKIRGKP